MSLRSSSAIVWRQRSQHQPTSFGLGDSAPACPTQGDRFSPRGRCIQQPSGCPNTSHWSRIQSQRVQVKPRRLHIISTLFARMSEQSARIPNRSTGSPLTSRCRCSEINPTGPSTITTCSCLANLVGRASYPYEGSNPVSSPAPLMYASRRH